MQASTNQKVSFVGRSKNSLNKLASSKLASDKGLRKAADLGLLRVAGNMFECPSTKDLWRVNGDKVIRVSSVEVDYNENLQPADAKNPQNFLASLLSDLDF